MYRKASVINLIQKIITRGESHDLTASEENKFWDFNVSGREMFHVGHVHEIKETEKTKVLQMLDINVYMDVIQDLGMNLNVEMVNKLVKKLDVQSKATVVENSKSATLDVYKKKLESIILKTDVMCYSEAGNVSAGMSKEDHSVENKPKIETGSDEKFLETRVIEQLKCKEQHPSHRQASLDLGLVLQILEQKLLLL